MPSSEKQRMIEAEFGEPFWDVVKGFADDGYSAGATGGILGYHPAAFRRLVARHGKSHWFPYGQACIMAKDARESRKGKTTPAMIDACKKASQSNPCYMSITHNGFTGTLADHARRAGIPVKTARNRYLRRKGDWAYVFSKTTHVKTPDNRGHYWNS